MTDCDVRPIKAKAMGFPEPVRTLILSEPDAMPLDDFLIKGGQWEKLLQMAHNTGSVK